MNKNRYRIIFSEARSMFIAVAEIVKSKTKAAGQTTATGDSDSEQTAPLMVNTYKKLNPLNFAVVSLLGAVIYSVPLSSMANTQIIADKSAPSAQQATVLNSSNGLTQVNIQTPSAGGVSRNTYTQFDVGQEGAILNNSRNNVQTQLGGWVQGNPWLGKGEAKVILNEVNSSNPSQLKGYLEVAGKSAQVVIANPSGLVCDGCGVINADRFSLAAGQAVVNQGYLESFRVRDGQVTIEGKGLNGSLTPYTDIYARALNVNAGLYANELTTVLGQNDIDVKDQTAPKVNAVNGQSSAQTAKPDFALDVAQLGGMYAGKIFLVGTEAGLGVRNAGSINAAENQLTLNANGDLVNTGNIVANKDQIAIQAHNVANSGNISSTKSKIQVDAADIQNSGLIATSDELQLNAQVKINNDTGVMNAGRIDLSAQNLSNAKGQIQQTGQQELNLTAKTLDNRQGVIGQATKDNTSGNQTGTTAPPVTNPEQNSSAQDSSSITVAEPIDLTPKTFDAGQIQIAQGIHNVSGQILNNADIGLSIQDSIINNGGAIQLPELQFNGQSFENQDGQLIAQVVNITAHNVDNQKGSVIAGESFDLNAVQVNNTLGRLQSSKNLSLKTAGLENSQGQIVAGQQFNIDASQLNNSKGIIASAESDAVLNADHLNNAEGEILAQNLQLTAQQLLNQQGNIYAAQNAQIEAADADNSNGQIAAEQALKINTQLNALNNQNGKMIANAVELNTGLLNNQAGLIQGKQSVKIDTNNNALINKDSGSTSGILSQGILDLAHVSQLDNSKGYMASVGSAQISVQNLNNKAGQISSQTDLNIQQQTAGGRIDNTAGQIQAQQNVHLNADTINNSGAGSHIAAGEKLTAAANQVLNAQTKDATVIGGFDAKNIEITAAELDNQSGVIRATDQAHLNLSEQLNNQLGTLSSLNALNIGTSNKTLSVNNAGGELLAKNQLNLKANELMNQGEIISEGNIDIDLKQSYTHTQDDQILANGTLKLNTENNLVNQSELSAGQKLELSAKNIRNETGASLSANDTHLTAQDTVHNQGLVNGELTHIQANQVWNDGARIYGSHVAIQAHTLDNKSNAAGIGAVIASRGDMDLGVKTLNNQSGGAVKEKAQDNAWIFSAGDLNIGGSLDLNLKAQGSADKIYNGSARIESLGDMYLGAKEIQNTNENLVIELIEKSREKITEYEKNGQRWDSKIIKLTDSGDADDAVLWVPAVEGGAATKEIGEDWTRYIYTNIHSEEEVQTTSPAQIIAGGNLGFDADTSFNNKDSQVLVGLAITSGLDKINNNNTDLHRVDTVAPGGFSQSHTVGWNSKGTEHRNKWGDEVTYQPAPVAAVLPVKLGEVKEYTQSQGNIDPTEQLNTQTVQRNIDAANTVVTGPLSSQQPESQDVSIRTVAQDHLTLPSNALYITAKDSQAQYIVETDPAFANYKKWLSSDYMLDALGLDPAMQQKRIGDGFYEQRLVQDQVAQLTGFRFLEGYGSDEEQYKALMNNGLSFAKQYGLRVGVALSEAQVAQLTSDIVWLEEKTVKLADGSTAKTLVPQVYVKARVGDLKGDGTLISANSIDLKVQGNVFNSGTIAGRQAVVLNADNVELMNGRIQANQVGITTQKDVNIVGGQIQAEKTADLNVGGNFNLSSSIQNSQNIVGESAFTYTGIDRVAGIYTKTPLNQVSTDTENLTQTITIRVGGDAKLVGSEIQNANGQTSIQSQGDLTIGAIQTGINNRGYANKDNFNYEKKQEDIGSVLQSAGDTRLQAENITVKGSQISSEQGSTILSAQQDIDISEGRKLSDTEQAFKVKEKGILSTKLSQSHVRNMSNEAIVSTLDGKNVILDANNLDIRGSNVVSDELTQIQAKEKIKISAAENQYANEAEYSIKKSGLSASFSDGVASVGYGKSNIKQDDKSQSTSLTQSLVSSVNGNTNIIAGKDLTAEASIIEAGKDINLIGKNVHLDAADVQQDTQSKFESKSSGISIGFTYSGVAAAAASAKKSQDNNDFSDSAVGKIMSSAETVRKATMAATTPVVFQAHNQKTSKTKDTSSTQSVGTEVKAGGNLNIIATEGDIRSQGAKISAEGDALLHAKNNVDLLATQNTESQTADSKRKGFSIDNRDHIAPLGVYNDKEKANGGLVQSVGTELSVGGKTTIKADDGNINIVGSKVVSTNDLVLNAGKDVNIKSAQNSFNQSEDKKGKGWGSAQISDTERFDGYMANQNKANNERVSQERSQVGSLNGSVNINAGNNYNQKVADVVAGKDINITAKNISIVDDQNTGSDSQSSKDLKVGVFSRITSPLIDLINAVDNAGKSKADDRTKALQGLAAGAQAYQTANTVNNVQKDIAALAQDPNAVTSKAALFKAEAGLGFSTSKNNQDNSYSASQGNVLNAGGNINLTSTEGDIHLKNTQVNAKDKISLDAAKDILLESGQSKEYADGKNSNAGAQVGVGVSVGAQTGVYVYAEAGYGKGSNHLESTAHNNTTLNADQISIKSQGDTTLKGAQATANRIDADVGGNLNIISQQDTLDQNSKQMGVGARVQVSAGTAWDASGNFNNTSAKGNSKQVNQQSGLFAGDGGYHVKADHVDLQGGAIASTASKEHNELTANSLKFSNIENESSHNATTVALSGGTRFGEEKGKDSTGAQYTNNVNWRDSTTFSPTLPQQDKDKDSGTTYATISEGNINIGGRDTTVKELGIHSDINTANQQVAEVPDLQAILDKQKIVSDATSTIVAATRTYSQNKQAEAEKQKQAAEAQALEKLQAEGGEDWEKYNSADNYAEKQQILKDSSKDYKDATEQAQAWGMGGSSSRALNAVTTAITAALGGQTDLQVVTNTLAPYAAQVIGQEFGHGENKNTAAQLVSHAILGATLAYINGGDPTAGGSAAVASEAAANYLTNQLAEKYKDDPKYFVNGEFQANLLSEIEKAQIRDLTAGIGAVIGGAVGDSSYNAQLAGVIGQNAVENNGFSIIDENYGKVVKENKKEKWSCPTGYICPIPEKTLGEKTLLVINDLTIRQLAAAMGAEYDPITKEHLTPKEIQEAKVAMLGLGFSKTLNGPIKLTEEAIENIGKKYGSKTAATITNNFYRDNDSITEAFNYGKTISLDPTKLSFSQATVSYQKGGQHYNYESMVKSMQKDGWNGDPVDIVIMPNGTATSMDNTRILAAREAGVNVQAKIRDFNTALTSAEKDRFRLNEIEPNTWGEAIKLRISRQKTQKGTPDGWSIQFPYGSLYDPKVVKNK